MKSGKRSAIGTVAVIGVALGLILHRIWPQDRLLLQRSTLIADTGDWEGGRRFYSSIGIHWLSDDTLLLDRFIGVKPNDHRIIYRRDVRTGREEELKELTKTRDGFYTEVVDSEAVSPDGRWYVCSDRWGDCLLAEVGGKRSYRYPSKNSDCYRQVLWMADGRRWLENFLVNGFSHRLVLHDVVNPKLSRVVPLADKGALYGHVQIARDPKTLIAVVNPNDDIGFNFDGSPPEPPADPRFVVTRFGLQARAQLIAQYHVMPPPHGGTNIRCWVSPQGDRIAWQVTAEHQNQILALAHRIIPSIQAQSVRTVELWVSGIDGGNMHELGHIMSPVSENDFPIWLNVKWLPGDRKLSYEYKMKLYTITAD